MEKNKKQKLTDEEKCVLHHLNFIEKIELYSFVFVGFATLPFRILAVTFQLLSMLFYFPYHNRNKAFHTFMARLTKKYVKKVVNKAKIV